MILAREVSTMRLFTWWKIHRGAATPATAHDIRAVTCASCAKYGLTLWRYVRKDKQIPTVSLQTSTKDYLVSIQWEHFLKCCNFCCVDRRYNRKIIQIHLLLSEIWRDITLVDKMWQQNLCLIWLKMKAVSCQKTHCKRPLWTRVWQEASRQKQHRSLTNPLLLTNVQGCWSCHWGCFEPWPCSCWSSSGRLHKSAWPASSGRLPGGLPPPCPPSPSLPSASASLTGASVQTGWLERKRKRKEKDCWNSLLQWLWSRYFYLIRSDLYYERTEEQISQAHESTKKADLKWPIMRHKCHMVEQM